MHIKCEIVVYSHKSKLRDHQMTRPVASYLMILENIIHYILLWSLYLWLYLSQRYLCLTMHNEILIGLVI